MSTSASYLTAAELGITEREREGLIAVRNDLASGRVRHVDKETWPIRFGDMSEDDWQSPLFNMSDYHAQTSCGTIHCLKGLMQARGVYSREERPEFVGSDALYWLFIPQCDAFWGSLSTAEAVLAIDHFLAGAGEECWPRALKALPA